MEITKKYYGFGDMVGVYATVNGATQFLLVPKGTEEKLNDEKIMGISPLGALIHTEPTMHVALTGDGFARDFTAGDTLRNSSTAYALALRAQELKEEGDTVTLVSRFENGSGLIARQYVSMCRTDEALTVWNELENLGQDVTVEALPSFNLSGISPFDRFHDPAKIVLHKMLSHWSGEGRLLSVPTDKLAFEPSWSGLGVRMEKWSQTGTMPARGQLPFVALEDTAHGVCWAAMMEAPASWVIETVFRNGNISVGGGRGDYLTAHWRKTLKTGERMRSDKAFLTVVKGGLNEACARLVKLYDRFDEIKPKEETLPVLYNEYCYSWCKPTEKTLREILPVAARLGCRYFVIDDGWFKKDYGNGARELGDWEVNETAFPGGLKAFGDEARGHGMDLGLWYEFEGVTVGSRVFREHPELLLTYGGKPVLHEERAFFDFRKEETREYLREKVIRNLAENKIGYMKVDYNENIGLGVDGAESCGEGLRGHIEGVIAFFEEIKRELPELVLEICSSGGMRHEPRFLRLADMVSFSDAHENPSGVNVACNLHRYIPPRKLQIWATIRDDYDLEDVRFTAAKAMLGRYCISGNLASKSEEVLCELERSVAFYRSISHIVARGRTTEIRDDEIKSYLNPVGRVTLCRQTLDGREKLMYAYAVGAPGAEFSEEIGSYRIEGGYNLPADIRIAEGKIAFTAKNCRMWGCVIYLVKE